MHNFSRLGRGQPAGWLGRFTLETARVCMECVRLVVDVWNWFEERKHRQDGTEGEGDEDAPREIVLMGCFDCDKDIEGFIAVGDDPDEVPEMFCRACLNTRLRDQGLPEQLLEEPKPAVTKKLKAKSKTKPKKKVTGFEDVFDL